MSEVLNKKKIRKVFRDAQKHVAIAQLIRRFSTNKEDIREKALNHADLSNCLNVLELGCAFGAFTEALKDKLHSDARITGIDIIPEYKLFFMEACRRAGYNGQFYSAGINLISKFKSCSFDLIICSYALYFFPEMIPKISRLLKKGGNFITITHSHNDMHEIVTLVRKILKNKGLPHEKSLPIEAIFEQFSAENGKKLLKPSFSQITEIEFKNALVFQPQDINHFIDYFQFKKSFFLTGNDVHNKSVINLLTQELQDVACKNDFITMCKDDKIFICSQPITPKERE